MKKYFLIFLFSTLLSYSAEPFKGIILQRGYPGFGESSSVHLKNIEIPQGYDELTFEFRVELLPPFRYGNLFHIFSKEESLLSIVYSTSKVIEKQGFIFSIPGHNFSKALPYQPQNSLGDKIDLVVSIKKNKTTFVITRDSSEIVFYGTIKLPDDVNIYFGATPSKNEGINLVLERFKINYSTSSKSDSLNWSFDKFTDNRTYDNTETYEAKFINAKPNVLAHFNWERLDNINIPSSGTIYMDETESIFYSLKPNSLYAYDFLHKESFNYKLNSKVPYEQQPFLFKNNFSDELLLTWSGGYGDISVWDSSNSRWTQIQEKKLSTDYFDSAVFVSPVDSSVYMLGGYGNYMFKNDLLRFSPNNRSWEVIPTSGDVFPPSKPLITSYSESSILVLPGLGSETGDQTVESRPFSDLYELNLKNYEFSKFANLFNLKHNEAIGAITWVAKDNEFYFLLITTKDTSKIAQVYNYDFELDSSFALSKPIHANLKYDQNLYYSSKTDELLLFEYDPAAQKTIHSISKISLPILSETEVAKYINTSPGSSNHTIFYFLASIVLVSSILWFFMNRRKGSFIYKTLSSKNSISFLGGFCIYDKNGENLESHFSTKILEAFLLIFIKSFSLNNRSSANGVSSTELSNTLWPDFDKDSQKNNRNVTINKIRHLLKDVNSLEIIYENSRWKIRLTNEMFVDLFELTKILEDNNKDDFISFINNHKIGEAFEGTSYEWLDPLKVTLNRFLTDSILKLYKENESSFSPDEIFKTGKSILEIDELSEYGIGLVIRSQKLKGNLNGYHQEYNLFRKKYFDLTGENFDKSAKDLEKIEF